MTTEYNVASTTSHEEDIVVHSETTLNASSSDNGNTSETDKEGEATHRQLGGAAVAGGILGLVIAGPMIGVVAGLGAAVASTRKGKAGEVVRASGETMASAGDRLKQWDRKHHVMEKTSSVLIKGCNKISKKLKPKNNSAANGAINATV